MGINKKSVMVVHEVRYEDVKKAFPLKANSPRDKFVKLLNVYSRVTQGINTVLSVYGMEIEEEHKEMTVRKDGIRVTADVEDVSPWLDMGYDIDVGDFWYWLTIDKKRRAKVSMKYYSCDLEMKVTIDSRFNSIDQKSIYEDLRNTLMSL